MTTSLPASEFSLLEKCSFLTSGVSCGILVMSVMAILQQLGPKLSCTCSFAERS